MLSHRWHSTVYSEVRIEFDEGNESITVLSIRFTENTPVQFPSTCIALADDLLTILVAIGCLGTNGRELPELIKVARTELSGIEL